MDEKLDKKLVERYPLLYADRHGSARETCMCWGFPGNGWYGIIRELSSKLEPLIQKYIDTTDTFCRCGEHKSEHVDGVGKCTTVFELPFSYPGGWCCGPLCPRKGKLDLVRRLKTWAWRFKWRVIRKVNKLGDFLHDKFNIHKKVPSKCEAFVLDHPRAMQVKEKFGTLRFYMTSETDEMSKLISEAENKSAVTCEDCGAPGEIRQDGWWVTQCNKCCRKRLAMKSG